MTPGNENQQGACRAEATARVFPPTRWTQVAAAGGGDALALEEVCARYWEPARKFLRALGASEEDAKDLAQEFFADWAQPRQLARLEPGKGRLRSYLKQALRRRLFDLVRERRAAARGGGWTEVDLEAAEAAETESGRAEAASMQYDREWAETALAGALEKLRRAYEARNREAVFQAVLPSLAGAEGASGLSDAARAAGLNATSFKVEVFRLRRRFEGALRLEISATVGADEDIDDEARYLLTVLARHGGLEEEK